jgi:nucleoside recognition membrane protein YjiH
MAKIGDEERKNLSIAIALLVGIPLFMIPTLIRNGYNISVLFLAMTIIYGITILYAVIVRHRYNMRGDTNNNIDACDI